MTRATGAPIIIPNKNGDAPSSEELAQLRAAAKAKGLFADWPYVVVLEEGDLLLNCEPQTGEHGVGFIAGKRNGEWKFYLDSDMLCRNPL